MSSVVVDGLDSLIGALRGADIRGPLRETLAASAIDARDEAKAQADRKQLSRPGSSGRGTGALIGGIKDSVSGDTGFVRNAVTNPKDRFAYPVLYEFARNRAFMAPGLTEAQETIYGRFESMCDEIVAKVEA